MSIKISDLLKKIEKLEHGVQVLRCENYEQHTEIMRYKSVLWGLFYVRIA